MSFVRTINGYGCAKVFQEYKSAKVRMVLVSQQAPYGQLPIEWLQTIDLAISIAQIKKFSTFVGNIPLSITHYGTTVEITWSDHSFGRCDFDAVELLTQLCPEQLPIYLTNLKHMDNP